MAKMDRVRFVAGDESEDSPVKVWQGFDAGTTNGSAGFDVVYVTAETLRQMADYDWDMVKDNAFDRVHNAPEGFWDRLAFGGDPRWDSEGARFAPDGVTPVYAVSEWSSIIVQRFNPDGGRTYDIVRGGVKVGVGHFGVWENVHPVTGIPEPVGFVVDEKLWKEGRSDTPPFARDDDEPEGEDFLVTVNVPIVVRVENAGDESMAEDMAATIFASEKVGDKILEAIDSETSFYLRGEAIVDQNDASDLDMVVVKA